jgi:tetratricopeptide (TPR) repeat protein
LARFSRLFLLIALSGLSSGLLSAKELPASLREAGRLYQTSNFSQAISLAEKVVKFSPDSTEAMLIIAMSNFNLENYATAKEWLRKVSRRHKNHPVAQQYIALIQEIEHRHGPFSQDMATAMDSADPLPSGKAFKRGWFGHAFPHESEKTSEEFNKPNPEKAPIALEVEAPIEKILMEKTVAQMAQAAFKKKLFLKSYLFYSQLLAANPQNRGYLLGKARSAFHMKRFADVIKTLGPIMLAGKSSTFSQDEYREAKKMMQAARQKAYE